MKTICTLLLLVLTSTFLQAQNVGIGTTTPKAKLHVSAGNTALTPYSLTSFLLESTDRTYLQFLTPANKEAGVMFGNPNGTTQGGVYYNNPANPEGLDFRTNGNAVRMIIDNAGNVEMKNGLVINGNAPSKGSVLVSTDNNGKSTWGKPYAFRAQGLVDGLNITFSNWNNQPYKKVEFSNTLAYNIGQLFSTNSNTFTVPENGIYHFDAQLRWNSADNVSMRIMVNRNGNIFPISESYELIQITNAKLVLTQSSSVDFILYAGDLIYVEAKADQNATAYIFHSLTQTYFSGHLVTRF